MSLLGWVMVKFLFGFWGVLSVVHAYRAIQVWADLWDWSWNLLQTFSRLIFSSFGYLLFLPIIQQTLPCPSWTGLLCGNHSVFFGKKMSWFWNLVLFWSGRTHKQAQNYYNFFFFLPKASCKSQSEWSVLKTELLHPGWDLSRFDRNIFKAGKQKLIQRGQNVLFWFLICKEDGSKMDGFSRQVWMSKKGHLGIKSIPPPLCFHSVAVPYGELWIISG